MSLRVFLARPLLFCYALPVMKADIHPTYYPNATITCACGAIYTVGSTKEKLSVEICAACHPFYTGTEKIIDTAGRVEKYKARREKASIKKITPAKAGPAKR